MDEFDKDTVIGTKHFTNIIATANPNAQKFVVLAAHYDSKKMEGKEFLGATDSAVPCAMIMSIAKSLDLDKLKEAWEYAMLCYAMPCRAVCCMLSYAVLCYAKIKMILFRIMMLLSK